MMHLHTLCMHESFLLCLKHTGKFDAFLSVLLYLHSCLYRKPYDRKKVEGVSRKKQSILQDSKHLDASFVASDDRFGMSFDNKYNSFLFSKNLI